MSTVIQRSFAAGEIAPALYSRVDTVKYATGLKTCRNFFVLRHGGISNRPGSSFIGEVKDSTKTVRLIPFVFNANQTYILEFGNLYMRVIRNAAYVTDLTLTITGITNANPAVLSYTGTDPANGEEVYISGVVGAMSTFVNNRNFKIANVNTGANTFELQYMNSTNVNSTAFGAYTSGGTAQRIYTITTPYAEADLSTLKFVQSADVITIAHPSYAPRDLARLGHSSWTIGSITFAPSIAAPTSPANNGAAGSVTTWVATAVKKETFEESLQSTLTSSSAVPTSGAPITVSCATQADAAEYNFYKQKNGIYGFIGSATAAHSGTVNFIDNGIAADTTDTPPALRDIFTGADNFPSAVSYFQQRLTFGNTNNNPETAYSSKTGDFHNFTTNSPIQDDDSIQFTMAGKQVNSIKHLVEVGVPLVFTSAGEWVLNGNQAGILTPAEINPKQQSYNGSSDLSPIVIGASALYVQARGSVIRDFGFDYQVDGYRGNDLTIFSSHLFDQYTLSDWTYQQIPHSIVWAARSDGSLLGLTYVKEQQIVGWHRHDFDGTVENVCAIPEGNEDTLYLVIKRTINGATKRYVEKLNTRQISDVIDAVFVDAALSYDGRNTSLSHTMTLSGGLTWINTEALTLTSSASFFSASDVGNAIHLVGSDGTIIRATITVYGNATTVTVKPNKTVPVFMRSVAILDWTRAVDQVTGLWHLEGEEVSVFADGFVVANPNNEAYEIVTVANGSITLDKPYGVIHVGMPYTSDLETLNIDTPQGESIANKNKNVGRLTVFVESSRGIWAGAGAPPDEDDDFLGGLTELKIRNEETYDEPIDLATGTVDVIIRPEWNSNGRVFIRQTDPIPLSVLAVAPDGLYPFRGAGG